MGLSGCCRCPVGSTARSSGSRIDAPGCRTLESAPSQEEDPMMHSWLLAVFVWIIGFAIAGHAECLPRSRGTAMSKRRNRDSLRTLREAFSAGEAVGDRPNRARAG